MNRADKASARHHTYLLFSRLYLDGVTADLLPYLAEIPELADKVSYPFSLDQAGAVHYQVFAHDIFPYESVYRDPSGLLGGIYADDVKSSYKNAGIHVHTDADHIGHELSFLAALCKVESDALNSNEPEQAAKSEQFQFKFLRDHLLCWLPAFVNALSYSDSRFYAAFGSLTLGLVYDQWIALNQVGTATPPIDSHATDLPLLSDLLQDHQTNLKQIAGFLITPPFSGLYMGRETIAKVARENQLPRGFGSRQQMLSNLFHSAAQYELMPDLLQDVARIIDSWGQLYTQQVETFPQFETHIKTWLQRLNSTSSALAAMQEWSLTT